MPKKVIIKPSKSAPAVGPYNHAVRIGDLLFCAGQIPIEPATGNLVSGDIKFQTQRVLENVKAILDDQNLTFANVVKSTVFLTNLADFAGMNEVYAKFFTEDFPPAPPSRSPRCPRARLWRSRLSLISKQPDMVAAEVTRL
jgi:2-iminobutanoate/2-iminopropanoate deaminase